MQTKPNFVIAFAAVILAVFSTLLLGVLAPATAAIVYFTTESVALKNMRLTDSSKLIGFVGDVVELKDGSHAPKDYTLQFTIKISGKLIEVMAANYNPPNCTPELQVEWARPRVSPHRTYTDVTTIILEDPKFGKPTGNTRCAQYSMAGCTKQKIILTAISNPANSEIWIGGEKQQFRTNATLSVPYCTYETTKDILLRIPNTVNCERSVDLAPDKKVEISCTFQKPGKTASKTVKKRTG
jgi:hypothetical protein